MDDKQYNNLLAVLAEIRDRLPETGPRPELIQSMPVHSAVLDDWIRGARENQPVGTPGPRKGSEVAADKRQALAIMRAVLDDWIKGARENHEALGHRNENRGGECWRSFHAEDIRNMINDAARELGLEEFPHPEMPEEDKR
jgi:hypothetical protein